MKRFLLTFSIVALILFARLPHALLYPDFMSEDGCIFFKQRSEVGFLKAVAYPYTGYLHVGPRMVALAVSWLPMEWAAFLYTAVCLVIASLSLAFFSLPHFRPLVAGDYTRTATCLLLAIMPNNESLMKLAYVDWYLLWLVLLTVTAPLPAWKWLLLPAVLVATWTSPICVVVLPVTAWRFMVAMKRPGDGGEAFWWLTVFSSTIAYTANSYAPPGAFHALVHSTEWIVSLFHALSYKVIDFFAYGDWAMSWELHSWPAIEAAALLATAALAVLLIPVLKNKLQRQPALILLYLAFVSSSVYVLRPAEWGRFINADWLAWIGNARHFYCGVLCLCVLGAMAYEQWEPRLPRRLGPVLVTAWACLHAASFHEWTWWSARRWADSARDIQAAERRTDRGIVHVIESPEVFNFDLEIHRDPNKPYQPKLSDTTP